MFFWRAEGFTWSLTVLYRGLRRNIFRRIKSLTFFGCNFFFGLKNTLFVFGFRSTQLNFNPENVGI